MLNRDKALSPVQSGPYRQDQVPVSLLDSLFLHLGHRDEAWATANSPLGVVFGVPLVHICEEEDEVRE